MGPVLLWLAGGLGIFILGLVPFGIYAVHWRRAHDQAREEERRKGGRKNKTEEE